jgi:hypothetical protein
MVVFNDLNLIILAEVQQTHDVVMEQSINDLLPFLALLVLFFLYMHKLLCFQFMDVFLVLFMQEQTICENMLENFFEQVTRAFCVERSRFGLILTKRIRWASISAVGLREKVITLFDHDIFVKIIELINTFNVDSILLRVFWSIAIAC